MGFRFTDPADVGLDDYDRVVAERDRALRDYTTVRRENTAMRQMLSALGRPWQDPIENAELSQGTPRLEPGQLDAFRPVVGD